MVQIDIPAACVVSMLSIDLGRKVLKREAEKTVTEKPKMYYRYLFRSIFFAGFVIAPAGIYLLAGWPGWENIYWSKRFEEVMHTGWVNALLPALFIMGIVLAGYVGHVVGYRWLIGGKEKYIRPTYIGLLIVVAVIVLMNFPSFLLVGTYDQYHNLHGQTREAMEYVWNNPHGFSAGWVGVMIYFVAAVVCLVAVIRKECRIEG
jgi:MFS family permease